MADDSEYVRAAATGAADTLREHRMAALIHELRAWRWPYWEQPNADIRLDVRMLV